MKLKYGRLRVLYSFPLRLGAARICSTAWYQVDGLAAAGADVTVFPAAISRPVAPGIKVRPTLARGRFRLPNRLVGRMAYGALHDWIAARRLERWAGQFDVVHTWPMGALRTLKTARRFGIPTFLERPNAHTRFAYEVVQKECERLGITMPKGHEHSFNPRLLAHEEAEYQLADYLLCPSEFVARTFVERGVAPEKLARHQYGFDERVFFPGNQTGARGGGLRVLFVGGCAPRKGLHYALEAWLRSTAHQHGIFEIAGEFIPGYAEKMSAMLAHPSVKVLGFRSDPGELMRKSDVLVLSTIEEGSALVTSEARGSGCVLLVSDASGAICEHMKNALVHSVGDVDALSRQFTMLDQQRGLLARLRKASLDTVSEATWKAAGRRLLEVYEKALDREEVSQAPCELGRV